MLAPLMAVKLPPASTCPLTAASVSTPALALCERRHHVAGAGADLRDVAHARTVDAGEVPADVGVRAVAAVEGDGVDRGGAVLVGAGAAHDVRGPGRHRVRRGRAEADDVGAGETRAALLDRGERADRVHRAAAVHQLADLLGR